jgi:hypothetical protein
VRNTFIALLAVNLFYLAWSYWVDEPRTPPANETLSRLPRLKLLSETPAEQRPAFNTRTTLNGIPGCMSVGPFGDIPNAAKAAGILSSKGFTPQQRAEESSGASEGFWVYVGGLKNEVEADKIRVKLEKSGIKDALVMPPGTDAGRRVSLGLFSARPQAEQRAAAVKGMGYKAEVAERKLPQVLYWIDLALRPGMTTVPITDLFAEGVDSRIAVQPCPARPPPPASAAAQSATAAAQPASVAAQSATAAAQSPSAAPAPSQPPAGTAPKLPLPAAPQPPTAGSPLATQIAATPAPAVTGTAR